MTIDWGTLEINIAVADTFMTLTTSGPPAEYDLDMDGLHLALRDKEDDQAGSPFLDTHKHTGETVLSGVTYARFVEIINGYTVNFEVTGADYVVSCGGANHNLADVLNGTNVNLIVNNAAGLIVTDGGGGTGDVTIGAHPYMFSVGPIALPLGEYGTAAEGDVLLLEDGTPIGME